MKNYTENIIEKIESKYNEIKVNEILKDKGVEQKLISKEITII